MTTMLEPLLAVDNGRAVPRRGVPALPWGRFGEVICGAVADGARVAALFGVPEAGGLGLFVVLADDQASLVHLARTTLAQREFPSLTPACPQVHLFEREIAEQYGYTPVGHPWLKPVRFARPLAGAAEPPQIGVADFYQVSGDEVHEVAVGPVHAGVIEPGHFRFQCHGEQVFHLEISLGYQHRGVERALLGGPNQRSVHYAETLSGDTTIGHATAYCQVLEALADTRKIPRVQAIRGIALELERLANHIGDLGALAGDVGFLSTASFCGRLRGDFLNMTAALCGSRFGRGLVRPGGVRFDVSAELAADLTKRLASAEKDCRNAVTLLWDSPSVMARFEEIGIVPRDIAVQLGLVGPAARASGLARDARQDHPTGVFRFRQIPVASWETGDVFARAYVRWLEMQHSLTFLKEQLAALPAGEPSAPVGALAPEHVVVSLIEGWRGELCHTALTDAAGGFLRYKVVDPSFHNWAALAYALRDGQISDFPVCNKSFNLSYCGHDL